jgi:hypothetical protein
MGCILIYYSIKVREPAGLPVAARRFMGAGATIISCFGTNVIYKKNKELLNYLMRKKKICLSTIMWQIYLTD